MDTIKSINLIYEGTIMFNKLLTACTILAASTGLAFANGGTLPPQHQGAFYLGGALSGDFGHLKTSVVNSETTFFPFGESVNETDRASVDLNGQGVNGEIFGGYGLFFRENYYLGIEAFGSISNMDGDRDSLSTSSVNGIVDPPSTVRTRAKIELDHSYGVVAMPGVKLTPTIMLYGRVGWIRSQFKMSESVDSVNVDDATSIHNFKDTTNGLQLGLGFGMALTHNISLRAEYDYNDYSDISDANSQTVTNGNDRTDITSKLEIDPIVHQIKIGVLYRFYGLFNHEYA